MYRGLFAQNKRLDGLKSRLAGVSLNGDGLAGLNLFRYDAANTDRQTNGGALTALAKAGLHDAGGTSCTLPGGG